MPLAQLLPTAREIAGKIAAKSPAMVKLAKEALTGIEDGNLEDKYRWEQGFTLEAYTMGTRRNRAMLSCKSATRSFSRGQSPFLEPFISWPTTNQ